MNTDKNKIIINFYSLEFIVLIMFIFLICIAIYSNNLNKLTNKINNLDNENIKLFIENKELGEIGVDLLRKNIELAQNISLLEKDNLFLRYLYSQALDNQRVVVLPKRINIELGAYNLKFDDKCWLGEQYVGCTSHGRDITLVDNRTVAEIIETCNHEWLHNQIKVLDSQFEEQVVRQLDDKVNVPECEALRGMMR